MIPRLASNLVRERLKVYPAVTLLGPRQCGKTTLAKALGGVYFDLEDVPDRLKLDVLWPTLLNNQTLVILDEAQSWPEIFPRLRSAIDQDRGRMGRFLLLGSVSPFLMKHVSESLAGRLSLVELTPLLLGEMPADQMEALWLRGGYPQGGILDPTRYPRWQLDYLSLLAQRDLPAWGLPAKPEVTQRLIRMVASLHGQTWNASQVAQSLGLNYQTINGYLDYLVGAFLLRRVEPYHANLPKRLTKRPKIYWRDSGLVHALLLVQDWDHLLAQSWVGASWEGFVLDQVMGHLTARGIPHQTFYFRTSDQYEIDLVLDLGRELWAIEAKLTSAPSAGDLKSLQKTASFIQADRPARCILVSRTPSTVEAENLLSTDLPGLLHRIDQL